jgi:hypothetical protein
MMITTALAGTALMLSLATTEPAVLNKECFPIDEYLNTLIEMFPPAQAHMVPISEHAKFMELFNNMPPTSDLKADEVWVVTNPRFKTVMLAFSDGGCLVETGTLGAVQYRNLRLDVMKGVM